jgi:hypothetical protein
MYHEFTAADRWTKKPQHCKYQALIVAIATRHADAVDIKFLLDDRPVWIALPHPAWAEYEGHFLKEAIESGLESGREMYTLNVDETLRHLDAVLKEAHAEQPA